MDTPSASASDYDGHRWTAPLPNRPSSCYDFQIAIICALTIEANAVEALFDCRWDDGGLPYQKAPGDPNVYSVGVIGRHNVVLAYMPGMGKASAAAVSASCRITFPHIKLAAVVGICGAVPFISQGREEREEILLGDVIISEGLVQYDFGRQFPDRFLRKEKLLDSLGRPTAEVRALLAKLKSIQTRREMHSQITAHMKALRNDVNLKAEYPGTSCDKLFESTYRHLADGKSCHECGCDGKVVSRRRLEQVVKPQPAIHFGLMASGDTVTKSGEERDVIAQRDGVIGFEMEGAGVWDNFPCIVIKGACDYSDSHKTKAWQQYAAASAASALKACLDYWAPSSSQSFRPKADDVNWPLVFVSELYTSAPRYEEQKDRIPERVPGTCEWFTQHERFQHWMQKEGAALLWVSADPGCGKSVLAKYLVDDILPSTHAKGRTTCYFFFKDDYEDQKDISGALRSILYQLFRQRPSLLTESILEQFQISRGGMLSNSQDLWRILTDATKGDRTGDVVCVLDALDECEEKGRLSLAKALSKFYSKDSGNSSLKFLVTSRPYARIHDEFRVLEYRQPTIHLSGESEAETEKISKEIDIVIQAQLDELGIIFDLGDRDKNILAKEISKVEHRTYLWVYLVFNNIRDDVETLTTRNIRALSQNLPHSVESAYEKILSRAQDPDVAKRLLQIVVVARRALSLDEMAAALAISNNHHSISDLDKDVLSLSLLKRRIREVCGLFVVIRDSKIYLLHQTAREFLVRHSVSTSMVTVRGPSMWRHSLHLLDSNKVLAQICIWYLMFRDFEQSYPVRDCGDDRYSVSAGRADVLSFKTYAARNWFLHARQANQELAPTTVAAALRLCDISSPSGWNWFRGADKLSFKGINVTPNHPSPLILTSFLGLEAAVRLLLDLGHADITYKDTMWGRSALSYASEEGYDAIVQLLLQRSKNRSQTLPVLVNLKDKLGRTPLSYAALKGHTKIAERLVNEGASLVVEDDSGEIPLTLALRRAHKETIELLLQKGATVGFEKDNIESRDCYGMTPLARAAVRGDMATVRQLLDKGAAIDAHNKWGETPLALACSVRAWHLVKALADMGADVEAKNKRGQRPLEVVCADRGITFHSEKYPTPGSMTAIDAAQMLLDRGADAYAVGMTGVRPLAGLYGRRGAWAG